MSENIIPRQSIASIAFDEHNKDRERPERNQTPDHYWSDWFVKGYLIGHDHALEASAADRDLTTAKLTITVDIKTIRKFAALADIDLTEEMEGIILGSTTFMANAEACKLAGDSNAGLIFAALIIAKQLEAM